MHQRSTVRWFFVFRRCSDERQADLFDHCCFIGRRADRIRLCGVADDTELEVVSMTDYTRELKSYLHPLNSIILPAGQSVVPAVAAGVTVGSVAWSVGSGNPFAAGGAAAGVVFFAVWLVSLAWWRSKVDRASIGDARKMQPEVKPAVSLRVELIDPEGAYPSGDFIDCPIDVNLMVRAAEHLKSRDWETSNLGGAGKVLTRSQAEAVRDWLIKKKLAAWFREDRHTVGWYVNGVGRSVLRRLYQHGVSAGEIDPPPPRGSFISQREIYARMLTHTKPQNDDLIPIGGDRRGNGRVHHE